MTDRATLVEHARALRELHRPGEPLVLPNAWDVPSAKAVRTAGFPVVATGSAAVAEELGYADQEGSPPAEVLAATARIAAAVDLPVTADMESGYGLSAGELVDGLLGAGVVGCNLEDTRHPAGELVDPESQAGWIAEVRAAASAAGVDLVINARTDVFILEWGAPEERVAEAVRRGRAYLEAGADCVYPIFAADPDQIAELVKGMGGPVNLAALPQVPSIATLAELGVARVSYGPGLFRLSQAHLAGLLAKVANGESPYA